METKRVTWLAVVLLAAALIGCTSKTQSPGTGMVQQPIDPGTMMNPIMPGATAGTGAPAPTGGMAAPGVDPTQTPMAGASAAAGTGAPMNPSVDAGTMTPTTDEPADPRGKCNLNSGFPGDEACLLPPPEGQGMQIHVGPTAYDAASVAPFVFRPGSESSQCWSFHTPNTEEVWYQGWELSGRPGTHHIINTMYATDHADGTMFTVCRDPGTGSSPDILDNLPGASKAYMPREPIAPENANLGRKIPARAAAQADMHYFNFTENDILREFWLNIYFIPKEQVKDEAHQIRGMGGISWTFLPIAPGTNMVYPYSCPITAPGRIIQLLGHYHAHGKRFTAWVKRAGGERLKVFEMYDYQDPQIFHYNSTTENPTFSDSAAGATSGILEVAAGDTLEWECHIINDSQNALTYSNEVQTGEMCNLWGASVGPTINCVIP